MSFPLELKTGFFMIEPCQMKVDSVSSQLIIEFNQSKAAYLVDYDNIRKVFYNPKMRHELAIQTQHDDYIGYIHIEEIKRGVIDFLKVEFGDKFMEINE